MNHRKIPNEYKTTPVYLSYNCMCDNLKSIQGMINIKQYSETYPFSKMPRYDIHWKKRGESKYTDLGA